MGISAQQYRIITGTFAQPQTATCRPVYEPRKKSHKSHSNRLKISLLLFIFLGFTWPLSASIVKSAGSQISHGNINYKTFKQSSSFNINHNFWAKMRHGNRRTNGIKLCQWNAGAGYLVNKQPELLNIIEGYKPSVLGITESCFKTEHDAQDVQIQDYTLYFASTLDNPDLNASRVSVYVQKDLKVKLRKDLMNDKFSSIWLELGKPRQRKILVCIVYREWQYLNQPDDSSKSITAQLDRWVGYLDQWETAMSSGSEICVLGDINLNFLKWTTSNISTNSHTYKLRSLVTQLFDRILPHGFVQLVSGATRISPGQEPSGLDHFYSNHPEKLSDVQAHFRGGSDHKLIFATRYTKSAISKPRIIRKRSFKDFESLKFIDAIRKTSWWNVYSCDNVEEAVTLMTSKINEILDVMAPLKSFQVRTKFAPWMSQNTKNRIKERDLAQENASKSKSNEDWVKYKALRNTVNSILRSEKKQWQQSKLSEFGNDSSSVWKNIKNWLGWSKGGPPTRLMENGNLCSKPKDLARIMNEFFTSKVKNLRRKLPDSPGNPLDLVRSLMKNRNCSFSIQPVHPDVILKIITDLKATQSCGLDNIDSNIVKLVKHELVPVITHIVNLSIRDKIFPHQWKTSKIIPLHKKKEVIYPENYRPVSLLPIFSKILERAIFVQVVKYLEENCLIHPSHHGFRQNHNTATALLQMLDVWGEAFEDKDISAVLMLDMSAAFDLVDHDLLVKKLALYGFEKNSLSWVTSYLSNRSQQVYVDGALSSPLEVDVGVPQGSILGPLLYIIFTNDLPECVHQHPAQTNTFFNTHCEQCGGICCFADDSTFTISSKDPEYLIEAIADKYKSISTYMSQNKLVLNSDKTHLMVMASSHQHRKYNEFGIYLDTGTEIIEPLEDEKLLGAQLANNFTWNCHIRDDEKSMFKILTAKNNALRKISQVANFKTRKMVASGLITSTLTYIIQAYGSCSDYLLDMLQVQQNRAARNVTSLPWHTSTATLLLQCG